MNKKKESTAVSEQVKGLLRANKDRPTESCCIMPPSHPRQIEEAHMTRSASILQPQRTIDELKELRALTGDAEGAQRVAFTDTWAKARAWMRAKLEQLPVEI